MIIQQQILNGLKSLPVHNPRPANYCKTGGCPFQARKNGYCEHHGKKIEQTLLRRST